MSNVYVISDLHFGHKNICNFRSELGLSTEEEHAEVIIDRWNSVVRKRDTVWVLGDACFSLECLPRFSRMKGNKCLVLGNHDVDAKHFLPYFSRITGFARYRGAWLSHAPIHPDELRGRVNVHGHTHNFLINDKRYISACCEQLKYTPTNLNDLLIRGD